MQKIMVCMVVLFLGWLSILEAKESSYYARVVSIQKITPHQKGYKITYLTPSRGDLISVYIPVQWFSYKRSGTDQSDVLLKAEMIHRSGPEYPYMIIFWKDGKFHHLRIYANDNLSDLSWGVLNDREDLSNRFDPSQDIDFPLQKKH